MRKATESEREQFARAVPLIQRVARARCPRNFQREDFVAEVVSLTFRDYVSACDREHKGFNLTMATRFAIKTILQGSATHTGKAKRCLLEDTSLPRIAFDDSLDSAGLPTKALRSDNVIRYLGDRQLPVRKRCRLRDVFDTRDNPADLAALRLDFANWAGKLPGVLRAVLRASIELGSGFSLEELSAAVGVGRSTIVRARRELVKRWLQYTA